MKLRFQIVSVFSTLALLSLLGIQVYWMVEASQLKKQLFEEKALLIVSRANEALNADQPTCQKIASCLDANAGEASQDNIGKQEAARVDSLLQHFLKQYQLNVSYSYSISNKVVLPISHQRLDGFEPGSGQGPLQIQLRLPESHQYLMSEMKPHFFAAILLIIILVYLFWQSNLALAKEKKLALSTRTYFNNMAHEIKTPLTGISLAVGRLENETVLQTPEKARNYTQIIKEESEKLKILVSKIALFHQDKSGIQLHKTNVDVHAVIASALKGLQMQIETHNADVQLFLQAQNPVVQGDYPSLQTVIQNLVDNALKYGGRPPLVRIRTANHDKHLQIEISDNGPGIAPEFQQQVFEPYFRIPDGERHNTQGFGLGLAEAKEKACWHGGNIRLMRHEGGGCTFQITLPHGG